MFPLQTRLALLALVLSGCGPSTEEIAERKRIECLDQQCEGDIVPQRDPLSEVALKVNGQWFVGPSAYFSTARNGAVFYWPSKTPAAAPGGVNFPERTAVTSGRSRDVSIEIFLRSNVGAASKPSGPGWYEQLQRAAAEGRVTSRASPRPGLEVWELEENDALRPSLWYVATAVKDANGLPPVLACDQRSPQFARCTMGFTWREGIVVDLRFSAAHGGDWPEIYSETIRVLSLLRKE